MHPLVAEAARRIADLARWIPTDRQDLGYVGLKCTVGGQIAVYVNRNFFGFALDRSAALAFHEQLGGRVKDKEPPCTSSCSKPTWSCCLRPIAWSGSWSSPRLR